MQATGRFYPRYRMKPSPAFVLACGCLLIAFSKSLNGRNVYQNDHAVSWWFPGLPKIWIDRTKEATSGSFPNTETTREKKKHARPLFYINCSNRDLCHCYSKISRQHYCCSCDSGACFPATASISTPGSNISVKYLKTGTKVLAANDNGKIVTTEIIGFLDRRPLETATYMTLETSKGTSLTLSPNHVLFKAGNNSEAVSQFAMDTVVGDSLLQLVNLTLETVTITRIKYHLETGAYVPLTPEGTLFVNGILVSCYASYPHSLAHSFLAIARLFPQLINSRESLGEANGWEESNHAAAQPTLVTLLKVLGRSFFVERRANHEILQVYPKVPRSWIFDLMSAFPLKLEIFFSKFLID